MPNRAIGWPDRCVGCAVYGRPSARYHQPGIMRCVSSTAAHLPCITMCPASLHRASTVIGRTPSATHRYSRTASRTPCDLTGRLLIGRTHKRPPPDHRAVIVEIIERVKALLLIKNSNCLGGSLKGHRNCCECSPGMLTGNAQRNC